jgi:hypothetical protein
LNGSDPNEDGYRAGFRTPQSELTVSQAHLNWVSEWRGPDDFYDCPRHDAHFHQATRDRGGSLDVDDSRRQTRRERIERS